MATGRVGVSGRAVKRVAPNSPRLTVKAKMAPAARDLARRGRSMVKAIFKGEAPSTAAASVRDWGMDRKAGRMDLTTKGKPTRAWAMGMRKNEVLRFKGGRSRVMIMPKPRVTADVDRGSMKRGSKKEAQAALKPENFIFPHP